MVVTVTETDFIFMFCRVMDILILPTLFMLFLPPTSSFQKGRSFLFWLVFWFTLNLASTPLPDLNTIIDPYDMNLQGLDAVSGIIWGAETRLNDPALVPVSRLNAPGSFGGNLPSSTFGPCTTVSTGQSCGLWNATIPGVLHFTV